MKIKENKIDANYIFKKDILVIGGCKGIGKEIVSLLESHNNIDVACRNNLKLGNNNTNFNKSDINFIEININKPSTLERLVKNYDYVFCCPGICHCQYLYKSNRKELFSQLSTNFIGIYDVIRRIQSIKSQMPKTLSISSTTLVLFTSIASFIAIPGYDLYGNSKVALNHLFYSTKNLKIEGIELKLVVLGNVNTEAYKKENEVKPELLKKWESLAGTCTPENTARYIITNLNERSVISPTWLAYFICIRNECENLIDFIMFPLAIIVVFILRLHLKYKFK